MGAFCSLADVETDYGEPIEGVQQEKAEVLIDRAEARIEQSLGPIVTLLGSGRTNITLVKQVIGEMVTTVLRNPDGVRSVTESVGPFSRSTGYGGSFTSGADPGFGTLQLTPRQRQLLGGSLAGSVGPVLGHAPLNGYVPLSRFDR